jgi:ribosome-interacting GTPase 1
MRGLGKTVILALWTGVFVFSSGGFADTTAENVEDYLPQGKITSASYVQIERDPGLDDFTRRMKEAREKNPEWYVESTENTGHQTIRHRRIIRTSV